MKILFVAGTLGKGGAEKQLYYLCKLLKQKQHQVKVISLTKGEFYENEIKNLDIEIHNIDTAKSKFGKLFEIYKVTKQYNPTILYGFHFYTGIYVGLVGRVLRKISIGSIRSNGITEKKSNGILAWLHYACPKIIVANSSNAIENVKRIFYNKDIRYLPNIIDLDYFTFKPKETDSQLSLLFIGSLKDIKQPQLFVELVALLVSENQNVKAKIIGEGNLEAELKIQAKELPIEFLGNRDDVRQYLYEADYLISTSKFEGTPNVMLEAFATGTPVLALYHEALSDWIKKGYLIKTNTLEEMKLVLFEKPKINVKSNRTFLEEEHSNQKAFSNFKFFFNP